MNEFSLVLIYKQKKRKRWGTVKERKTKQTCHKDIKKITNNTKSKIVRPSELEDIPNY